MDDGEIWHVSSSALTQYERFGKGNVVLNGALVGVIVAVCLDPQGYYKLLVDVYGIVKTAGSGNAAYWAPVGETRAWLMTETCLLVSTCCDVFWLCLAYENSFLPARIAPTQANFRMCGGPSLTTTLLLGCWCWVRSMYSRLREPEKKGVHAYILTCAATPRALCALIVSLLVVVFYSCSRATLYAT